MKMSDAILRYSILRFKKILIIVQKMFTLVLLQHNQQLAVCKRERLYTAKSRVFKNTQNIFVYFLFAQNFFV